MYRLNPRAADPTLFCKGSRDKTPLLAGLVGGAHPRAGKGGLGPGGAAAASDRDDAMSHRSGQRSKPGSEYGGPQGEGGADPPAPMTETEKRRVKAEEWASSVSTDQLVRAKLQVLRELGHEERELSQWWLAHKTCYYLRPRVRE